MYLVATVILVQVAANRHILEFVPSVELAVVVHRFVVQVSRIAESEYIAVLRRDTCLPKLACGVVSHRNGHTIVERTNHLDALRSTLRSHERHVDIVVACLNAEARLSFGRDGGAGIIVANYPVVNGDILVVVEHKLIGIIRSVLTNLIARREAAITRCITIGNTYVAVERR